MKKGISLIVLVITIIVMIIIAGAIIISLNSTSVIEKANDAVTATDVQSLNDKLNLAYVDLKLDNQSTTDFSTGSVKVGETTYDSATAYYKAIVPEVDSTHADYAIPTGYKLTVNANGTALVEAE